jgi:hypothetical protein
MILHRLLLVSFREILPRYRRPGSQSTGFCYKRPAGHEFDAASHERVLLQAIERLKALNI